MLARLVSNSWPRDLPAPASPSAGITGMHCTRPCFFIPVWEWTNTEIKGIGRDNKRFNKKMFWATGGIWWGGNGKVYLEKVEAELFDWLWRLLFVLQLQSFPHISLILQIVPFLFKPPNPQLMGFLKDQEYTSVTKPNVLFSGLNLLVLLYKWKIRVYLYN